MPSETAFTTPDQISVREYLAGLNLLAPRPDIDNAAIARAEAEAARARATAETEHDNAALALAAAAEAVAQTQANLSRMIAATVVASAEKEAAEVVRTGALVAGFAAAAVAAVANTAALNFGTLLAQTMAASAAPIVATTALRLAALEHVRRALIALQQEEDEEDYIYKPTDYALTTALRVLSQAYLKTTGVIPRPLISPDGQGGLRLEWRKPTREIRMVFPARQDQKPYLYYESGDKYRIVENLTGDSAALWLTWLNNA